MSRNILLADDSLTIQKVVELTFMEGDFEVEAVGDGDEALVRLESGQFDVVIADVHMPGADGFEICRQTKERHPGTPVLLLVGTFEPFEEDTAREVGADAYLKKPFDSQELMRLVQSLATADAAAETAVATQDDEADDVSFGSLDEPSDTEVSGAEIEEADSQEPIALSEASETEVIETFGEVSPVEETEMGDSETGFEPAATTEFSAQGLSEQDVEKIARRVAELIGDQVIREISWDVIPDLAEIVIKDRIKELESQID